MLDTSGKKTLDRTNDALDISNVKEFEFKRKYHKYDLEAREKENHPGGLNNASLNLLNIDHQQNFQVYCNLLIHGSTDYNIAQYAVSRGAQEAKGQPRRRTNRKQSQIRVRGAIYHIFLVLTSAFSSKTIGDLSLNSIQNCSC